MKGSTEKDARALAKKHYGVEASAHRLVSELDVNYHLIAQGGEEYILKIIHQGAARELIEIQIAALNHLAENAPALILPKVQATTSGESLFTISGEGGGQHFVWMLS